MYNKLRTELTVKNHYSTKKDENKRVDMNKIV